MKRDDGAPPSGGKMPGFSPPEMSREERIMNRNHTQYLILTALFTALTAVGAFIRIPVGPTPITLQLLFIALAGVLPEGAGFPMCSAPASGISSGLSLCPSS